MRGALALFVLWPLAGCGGGSLSGPEMVCHDKVYEQQDVKDLINTSNSQQQQIRGPALIALDQMVRRRMQACLADKGLAPRGGVEPVQQY